ncbi:OLC1v1033205C1 [Oldenlandia corymbosa var. corymbosa]|uniref:OLC1v1033205C1 n=1 Tax=Oldenlandia corymbosa var. corymbosa TaxID=529605 RepID=A0AAV1CMV0_OLDCO|nr:OLC1v1033205C1 [Oldenlandia corymbosa var. corymbosa]
MSLVSKVGDWGFKAFTATLGVATIYLAGTFSVNVYRGLAWHSAESKLEKLETTDEKPE